MKHLLLLAALLVFTSPHAVQAGDSERIRQLEDEIKALTQESSAQGGRIQALESRVNSQASSLAKHKTPSTAPVSMIDDGQPATGSRRAGEEPAPKDGD